ncbi:MAG: TGS domain-containing protein, partial [Rikenellaceae bacterium]
LYEIKSELEDLSLKYSFPEEYKLISNKISETENARNEYIDNFNAPIIESLRQNNIEFEVTGRVKSIYSIWRKMQRKSVTIDEVYDLFAIRIVFKSTSFVPEKSQCWHIYSLVTDIYKPKPDRIRDWVNIPKANGYEALHCTVMGQNGNWVEIQIRSTRMNDIAERGFAAHWKYKAEGKDNNDNSNVLDKWIKDVRSALNSPTKDASEFLDDFKLNLYNTEVVVFTPNGETKTLPKGAIILDFAYEVHSKLGHTAIGAKVNHKIVPLYTEIQSGDQIEIITSSKSKPKLDWLSYVITAKSKQAIKTFLKKDKESTIDMGIEMFDAKLRALHVDPKGNVFKEVLSYYGCATKDEFYSNLSLGLINLEDLDDVVSKVKKPQKQNKLIRYWSLQLGNTLKFLGGKPKQEGKSNEIVVAKCCNPMPGD